MDRPLYEFVAMARRLFMYQGVLQYRAMEAQEELEEGGSYQTRPSQQRQVTREGVDMRHNQAAAKSAAKGLKGEHAEDFKLVPAATWMSVVPPGTVEHVEVKV